MCSKDSDPASVEIIVTNPQINSKIQAPDTIKVEFQVTLNKPIEYIRVSIDNNNMIPLTKREFIYPETNSFSGSVQLILDILTNQVKAPPYNLHIAVSDYNEIHHHYTEVDINNSEIIFKGPVLISTKPVNTIVLNIYNSSLIEKEEMSIDGNFLLSESSTSDDMLFIATKVPELVTSIDPVKGEIIWKKDPQLPYPETTGLTAFENNLYISTSIGRVLGVSVHDATTNFLTQVKPDTIPNNVAVTEDYVFTDCGRRSSNNKIWISYYRSTGSYYLRYPNDLNTMNLFSLNNNRILIFANNSSSRGNVVHFDIESNEIQNNFLSNIRFDKVCQVDNSEYLISENNRVYHYDSYSNNITAVYTSSDSIVDLKYEYITKSIIVSNSDKAIFISFPNYNQTAILPVSTNLVSTELIYGY